VPAPIPGQLPEKPDTTNVSPNGSPSGSANLGPFTSNWFTMSLNLTASGGILRLEGSDTKNITYATGIPIFEELVYAAISGSQGVAYRRLPMQYLSQNQEIFSFDFDVTGGGCLGLTIFSLYIENKNNPGFFPDTAEFNGFQYRFIGVPKIDFESLNLNWDDYEAVAQALNLLNP